MSILISDFELVTGLPEFAGYVFIFIFGAAVGSFLNVVIHRIPNEESIVFPNSACPNCKNSIKPYDNIPILSWLFLGGKCRNCKNPISVRYPAVELLTALLFLLVYWQIGFNAFLPVCLIFVAATVALIFIDAENMILPNVITYPLLVFALLARLIFPFFSAGRSSQICRFFH
jgi:leader peptidase (prepilin peptidase)/N-methyltransferase